MYQAEALVERAESVTVTEDTVVLITQLPAETRRVIFLMIQLLASPAAEVEAAADILTPAEVEPPVVRQAGEAEIPQAEYLAAEVEALKANMEPILDLQAGQELRIFVSIFRGGRGKK